MTMATDLDQGGAIREWLNTYYGPTLGWIRVEANDAFPFSSISINGTVNSLTPGIVETLAVAGPIVGSGNLGNGSQAGNIFNVATDTAAIGNGFYIANFSQDAVGGSAATGGRYTSFDSLFLTAPTNASNPNRYYAAAGGQAQANTSDGG